MCGTRMCGTRSLRLVVLLVMAAQTPALLAESPPFRLLRFDATDRATAKQWRQTARTTLATLLNIDDLIAANRHDDQGRGSLPLNTKVTKSEPRERFVRYELTIESRPGRRIDVVMTIPREAKPGASPAVVCIHGHGGNRHIVYEEGNIYRGFATALANGGYVTLSTDVGQHEVQDEHRTLMGERLWDLIRLVDLAASRPEVDTERIGCAGLSLGGEMAMWLGAIDPRIRATVSSGFLTTMENLRHGHCMCWDFPGLQRRYEFADIYSMISPRALQCQNGRKERLPGGFPIALAEEAMETIRRAYRVDRRESAVELLRHPEGHVIDLAGMTRFLSATLLQD